MQVILFFSLMILFLLIGSFFLLVGGVSLSLRRRRRKKGLPPQKRHGILAESLLPLGGLFSLLPVFFFLFLRGSNLSTNSDYVDTGHYVEGGYQENAFTVDGVDYAALPLLKGPLWNGPGEAAFSWDSTPSGADGAWYRLFGYYNRGNYLTVENDAGLALYSGGGSLFCATDQRGAALNYYNDPAHFDWYVSDAAENRRKVADAQGIEVLQALQAFAAAVETGAGSEITALSVTLPLDERLPYYLMVPISQDGVVQRNSIYLHLHENALYLPGESGVDGEERFYTLYPLPAGLSDTLLALLPETTPSK